VNVPFTLLALSPKFIIELGPVNNNDDAKGAIAIIQNKNRWWKN
jgi:hypothetical protein